MKRSLSTQVPAFIATRTVINTAIRMVYPFLPVFGRGLGVDLQTLSLGLTLRASSGVLGPFLASVADSRGRKTGMLFGMSLFIAGCALMVVWPTYPAFVLALVLTILGNFVFVPSMQAYLGDRVPYQRRGLVMALTEFGWSLSFIIGVPLVGLLIVRRGWQAPFPVLGGLGVLALVCLAALLPRDARPGDDSPGLWRNLRAVLGYPPALAGIGLAIFMTSANELVNLIFGVWLEETFAVKIAALAAASAVIGFSELGGEALVSVLTDWLGKHRAVRIGLVLNGAAALALPFLGRSLAGALAGLFLLYLTFEFTLVSSLPLISEVLPAARATLMAAFVAGSSVGRALGALMAPPLYAYGAQLGGKSNILIIVLVAAVINLAALFILRAIKTPHSESTADLGQVREPTA